jgi:hypothetical protein
MSVSPRKAVAGLDTLTPEETALFKQMESDDAAAPMEPAPTPAPEPEAHEPEIDEPAAPKPAEKVVDKRALDEERSRRKKAEKDATEARVKYEAELAKVNTRFEMLQAAIEANNKAPAAETAPAPTFDADPKAWIEHQFKALTQKYEDLGKQIAPVQTATTQINEQQRQQQQVAELQEWGRGQEAEFMAATPDYTAAVQHLKTVREATARAIGIDDPTEIARTLQNEVLQTAAFARQKGKNFGEVLYNLAKANGYNASPAASVASRAAPAETAAERILRGQDMAATLGATGAAAKGETAVNAIASMDDAQFQSLLEKMKGDKVKMRNVFGN